MTKKTYGQRIDALYWLYCDKMDALVVSESSAKDIALEADQEIANLKRLLSVCQAALLSTGYDLFDNEINKALNND